MSHMCSPEGLRKGHRGCSPCLAMEMEKVGGPVAEAEAEARPVMEDVAEGVVGG